MHMRALGSTATSAGHLAGCKDDWFGQGQDRQVRTPTMLNLPAPINVVPEGPVHSCSRQRKALGRISAAGSNRSAKSTAQLENRIRAPGAAVQEQDEVRYKDSWTDIAFIGLCRKAYGNIAGWQSPRDWKQGEETYRGMVEVSKAMMKV